MPVREGQGDGLKPPGTPRAAMGYLTGQRMTVTLQSVEDQRWQEEVTVQRGRAGGPPEDPSPPGDALPQFQQCINFPKCRSLVLPGSSYHGFCQGCVEVACNLRDHGPLSLPDYVDASFTMPPGIFADDRASSRRVTAHSRCQC